MGRTGGSVCGQHDAFLLAVLEEVFLDEVGVQSEKSRSIVDYQFRYSQGEKEIEEDIDLLDLVHRRYDLRTLQQDLQATPHHIQSSPFTAPSLYE